MKANLISDAQGFMWEDLSIDRSYAVDELILGHNKAQDHGDKLYSSPDLLNAKLKLGYLYELIYKGYSEILTDCPWISRDQHSFLLRIIGGRFTPGSATSLKDLHDEFPKQNNAWFGIEPKEQPRYVNDEVSWQNLHRENVREFYPTLDKRSKYFTTFYVSSLRVPANSINQLINRKAVDPMFKRLDIPSVVQSGKTLHGEQVQMHFNDDGKSALNLNGEWKHGGFEISDSVREQLIDWGFIVPN